MLWKRHTTDEAGCHDRSLMYKAMNGARNDDQRSERTSVRRNGCFMAVMQLGLKKKLKLFTARAH